MPVWPDQSGFVVPGDARALVVTDFWPDVLVGVNDDNLLAFQNRAPRATRRLVVEMAGQPGNPTGIGARANVPPGWKFAGPAVAPGRWLWTRGHSWCVSKSESEADDDRIRAPTPRGRYPARAAASPSRLAPRISPTLPSPACHADQELHLRE